MTTQALHPYRGTEGKCNLCGGHRSDVTLHHQMDAPRDYEAEAKEIMSFCIGYLPCFADPKKLGYVKGDEKTPFFSEAYLYNLMGKDAARTVLAYMHRFLEATKSDRAALLQAQDENKTLKGDLRVKNLELVVLESQLTALRSKAEERVSAAIKLTAETVLTEAGDEREETKGEWYARLDSNFDKLTEKQIEFLAWRNPPPPSHTSKD